MKGDKATTNNSVTALFPLHLMIGLPKLSPFWVFLNASEDEKGIPDVGKYIIVQITQKLSNEYVLYLGHCWVKRAWFLDMIIFWFNGLYFKYIYVCDISAIHFDIISNDIG